MREAQTLRRKRGKKKGAHLKDPPLKGFQSLVKRKEITDSEEGGRGRAGEAEVEKKKIDFPTLCGNETGARGEQEKEGGRYASWLLGKKKKNGCVPHFLAKKGKAFPQTGKRKERVLDFMTIRVGHHSQKREGGERDV